MAEELLSLKWNNHQAHFVDILTFLREQEIFIDATLACGGKLYPAHKFVLSTCSDYFKQMFTKNPSKHPIVYMKDVTCRDLEALLDFMYNGEVNVPQSSLGSLIKTAEGLQIKGLAVPDDPPFSKRDHSLQKERRDKDQKPRRDKSFSPPPKRFRERDRSPLISSASSFPNRAQSRSKSPHISSNNQHSVNTEHSKLEESLDEDSRTSIHSGVSEHSQSANSKVIVNSQCHINSEDNTGQSQNPNQPTNSEPSPGPSGLHRTTHSKEEELDIKQEEDMGLVDLGGEDDDDWRDGEGMEGNSLEDGSVDTNMSSANAQSFSDVLLPLSDGSLPSGDPAMGLIHDLSYHSLDFSTIGEAVPRPFPCSFCGRRFKRKDHRVEHERIHTGERPYVCCSCNRAFVQKHQLVSHAKRKHGSLTPDQSSSIADTDCPSVATFVNRNDFPGFQLLSIRKFPADQ